MKFLLLALLIIPIQGFSAEKIYQSEGQKFSIENLVVQKDVIWGFDFLPNDKLIFTERGGKIFTYDLKTKKLTEIMGAPKVFHEGQGGLLDIRVHPKNGLFYMTYSESVDKGKATTAFAQARLQGDKLVEFKKIFSAHEPSDNDIHFGSRIEFDGKYIYVSVGERNQRDRSQSLQYHQGKILRFNEDGSVPRDNPFAKTKDAKPEIWTYGHRNPQGLTINPVTRDIWEAEFGPMGGDEVNLIQPGKNYGWPVITYGREYWGPKIGEKTKTGLEQPVIHWVPSISPSAATFYQGTAFPKWVGNMFLATLSSTHIHRLVMDKNKVAKQEELIGDLGYRFRNIRPGPEGYLYFSTDEGKIGRLVPVK